MTNKAPTPPKVEEVIVHEPVGELEASVEFIKESAFRYRRALIWAAVIGAMCWLMVTVREVTALVLLSYAVAVLLDPVVSWFERKGFSRSLGVICIGMLLLTVVGLVIMLIGPALVEEASILYEVLPSYLRQASEAVATFLNKWFHLSLSVKPDKLWMQLSEYSSSVNGDQIKGIGKGIGATVLTTVLSGYSLTLTLLNLALLPLFIFYISCDLDLIHGYMVRLMPREVRKKVVPIAHEILDHVYAFFRGQLTVCLILAVLYSVGLAIAGLPYSLAVGVLAGFLSIVPYLGVTVGLILSTVITLVTQPVWSELFQIWAAFGIVQILESFYISPKIVGESVGIHPLVIMIVLIVAGNLLGLVGLIIAVPTAAAVRVLLRHLLLTEK